MSDNCQIGGSADRGEGLYAKKDFVKGQVILICEIDKPYCQNSVHASQIDWDKYHQFTKLGRSINHSCDPNTGIGFDGENWLYVAFKDVKAGQELTYDYAMANVNIQNMPSCICQSPKCRKEITGFGGLPYEKKLQYRGFFAPYLEQAVQNQTK